MPKKKVEKILTCPSCGHTKIKEIPRETYYVQAGSLLWKCRKCGYAAAKVYFEA